MQARKTIYYGWANLAVAALAMVATLPGRTQGLGLVTESLIADMHIDRVSYATINLWATLIGAAFCLPCGRLLDRYGSRIVLTLTVLFLGATVVGMRWMQGVAALSIAITLTRGFGQSALSVVSLALVGKWFARRLNLAMGVYALLVGIGFIAAFPSVGAAVLKYGWRASWGGIGWVLLLIVAPVSWAIVRNQPEDRGLELDGVSEPKEKLTDLTTVEALRSPAFWIFALSSSLFGLVYSGISLFNESILVERGFNASVYHDVLVISTMLGLLANFGGGWLATKMPIQRLSGIGMAALAVALVILPMVKTYTHVMIYGAIMGVAGGVVTVVFFSVWGQVFGRAHLGRIQGCAQMMTVFASAMGPLLLAETLRSTGSYDFIFNFLAVLTVALGFAAWFVALPVRQIAHGPDRIILSTGTA
ncbi:MAG TPA: MFS transporter [Bryobacteraceae bacterium]|nr:MFS transporter [Bryobacteraceae bacterium]